MANFAQTVTNSLGVLGMSNPTLWNNFKWGETWGVTGDLGKEFDKDTISLSLTITDSHFEEFDKSPIIITVDFTEDIDAIMKMWGIWDYVFAKPTTDGDEKVFDQFTKTADVTDNSSQVSDPSTTWSNVT